MITLVTLLSVAIFLLVYKINYNRSQKSRYSREHIIVDNIFDKHQNGELQWKCKDKGYYRAYIDDLKIHLHIFSDNTCWLRFSCETPHIGFREVTLKSNNFPKLKAIMKDIKYKEEATDTEIDRIYSKLKIDKSTERDYKINQLLSDESILGKIKKTFINN